MAAMSLLCTTLAQRYAPVASTNVAPYAQTSPPIPAAARIICDSHLQLLAKTACHLPTRSTQSSPGASATCTRRSVLTHRFNTIQSCPTIAPVAASSCRPSASCPPPEGCWAPPPPPRPAPLPPSLASCPAAAAPGPAAAPFSAGPSTAAPGLVPRRLFLPRGDTVSASAPGPAAPSGSLRRLPPLPSPPPTRRWLPAPPLAPATASGAAAAPAAAAAAAAAAREARVMTVVGARGWGGCGKGTKIITNMRTDGGCACGAGHTCITSDAKALCDKCSCPSVHLPRAGTVASRLRDSTQRNKDDAATSITPHLQRAGAVASEHRDDAHHPAK